MYPCGLFPMRADHKGCWDKSYSDTIQDRTLYSRGPQSQSRGPLDWD